MEILKPMEKIASFSIIIIVIFNCYLTALGITVTTNNGEIEGLTKQINKKTVYSFLGIPYAEPPVGQLRFKKPVPVSNFAGTYSATQLKSQCYQTIQNTSVMSEDCLYLNIWTPTLEKYNLPVMFWIHEGGFISGSGTELRNGINIYDGTQLAMRDVVLVTINYRLGAFGFLYSGTDEAPGNVGLWDQVLALQWVIDNIEAFGGDPYNICLFGASAGSVSISTHILSPITRHLFKNAIMESGSIYLRDFSSDKNAALAHSINFATNASYFQTNNCTNKSNNNKDWVQCLKNISAPELNAAQQLLFIQFFRTLLFKPVYGTEFLPKDINEAIIDGDFKRDVNLFIGHNEMEGEYFANNFDQLIGLNGRYDSQIPYIENNSKALTIGDISFLININNVAVVNEIADLYTAPYHDISPVDILTSNQLRRSASHAFGDELFTCPTILFGAKLAKHVIFKGNVYQYRLTYTNPESPTYGSIWANNTHLDDLPLVFGRPLSENNTYWTQNDRKISRKIMKIWTQFARNGTLPDIDYEKWPKYEYTNGNIIASYVELNPFLKGCAKIYYDRYKCKDGYIPRIINSCLTFWNQILTNQFLYPNN